MLMAALFVRRIVVAGLLLMVAVQAWAAGGEVVFVRGEVRVVGADGSLRAVKPGDVLEPGQALRTGADGHAHLRFPDGGFVGVRPGSSFALEAYSIDPAAPGGVKVRYRLDAGTVRSITGSAIEKDKSRFRFNTPLAAIGVRGTDYLVQVADNVARASVYAGAIVLAPFAIGCDVAGLGPCETSAARILTAAMSDAYVEYRAGARAPEIKKAVLPGVVPALPEEPAPTGGKQNGLGIGSAIDPAASASGNALNDNLMGEVAERAALPVPPPLVVWGRWSSVAAATPTVLEQLAKGYAPIHSSPVFGLLSSAPADMSPTLGVVGFNLRASEAYRQEGAVYTSLLVRDATLTIDFGGSRFDTRLTVEGGGVSLPLTASGIVQWQGYFLSDAARSTMDVAGIVAGPQAAEAGYLFEKALAGGGMIYGATAWRK